MALPRLDIPALLASSAVLEPFTPLEVEVATLSGLVAKLVRQLPRTTPADSFAGKTLLTVADAAAISSRCPDTVRRAIRRKALKATKPKGSREWIIERGDLDRWLRPDRPLDVAGAVEREVARGLKRC